MLNAVEKGFDASGDTDTDFLNGKHQGTQSVKLVILMMLL